jgi:hypothetical protein
MPHVGLGFAAAVLSSEARRGGDNDDDIKSDEVNSPSLQRASQAEAVRRFAAVTANPATSQERERMQAAAVASAKAANLPTLLAEM